MKQMIQSIRNIVGSFFYLIALGVTQIGNFCIGGKKNEKISKGTATE